MRIAATLAFVLTAAFASSQTTLKVIPAPPDVKAAPADAAKTASGLASKVLTKGTGTAHPRANDEVTVHYTGWTTEGVQLMVVGEKRRFWIPEALAYRGQRDPRGTLVFDVELIKIK